MQFTTCNEHFHADDRPCPWPSCEKGIAGNQYSVTIGDHEPLVSVRGKLEDIVGRPHYFWRHESDPVLFQVLPLVRQDGIRRSDWRRRSIIYHYTTAEAMFRILDTQELWLTDHAYLNDASEMIHGLQLAAEVVGELAQGDRAVRKLFREAVDGVVTEVRRPHVASFALHKDSLSLWKAYARGACGVAIGFDASALERSVGNHFEVQLARAIYTRREKLRRMRNLVHFFRSAWIADREAGKSQWRDLYVRLAGAAISSIAVVCKDSGFSDEREVRLVFQEDISVTKMYGALNRRFRPSGVLLVPYVSTKGINRLEPKEPPSQLRVCEIIVGPHPQMNLVARGVRDYLDSTGYSEVSMSVSRIPFR